MLVRTKYFGDVDLSDDKIITFNDGIMGFEECKKYTIIYDLDSSDEPKISWLQSVDRKELALPIINPFVVDEAYNPIVEDEMLKPLGELTEENTIIFLALTVPKDVKKMSANMKAPFIINCDTRKGCQIIVENQDYQVKNFIYEKLQKQEKEKGED